MSAFVALALLLADVAVIAHRGDHTRHAENTLPAYEAAFDAGADSVEVDVRSAPDGRLALKHGRLEPGEGAGLPLFEDALKLAKRRGRGIYAGIKDAPAEAIVASIDAAGMGEHVVIHGSIPLLKSIQQLRPSWRVMPEAVNREPLARIIEELKPRVAAFDARDFTEELIGMAKRAGVKVFADRLGPLDPREAWGDAIRRGADGIQPDRPGELVEFVRRLR
jgi:glycerophosphoryl diester phosphodiesterase